MRNVLGVIAMLMLVGCGDDVLGPVAGDPALPHTAIVDEVRVKYECQIQADSTATVPASEATPKPPAMVIPFRTTCNR